MTRFTAHPIKPTHTARDLAPGDTVLYDYRIYTITDTNIEDNNGETPDLVLLTLTHEGTEYHFNWSEDQPLALSVA